MAWDRQGIIEDGKSNMDLDNSDNAKSPPGASIESIGGGSTINTGLPFTESTHQCPESHPSSAGNFCGSEQTDPEARKSREAWWLQLFQQVEKQCQEQIDAQQEQFNHQLQLIREEIKHVAQLQGNRSLWNCGAGNAVLTQEIGAHPPSADAGQHSQDEERGESTNTAFHLLRELDIQKRAFITQEPFQESTSISSGYGTLSASEPNACLSSCSQNTSWKARLPAKQTSIEFTRHPRLTPSPVASEKPFTLVPDTKCLTHLEKSTEGNLSGSHEKRAVSQASQPNSKPLTTWAQKLKQTQRKRSVQMDQSASSQSNPLPERVPDNTDGSSNMFFLNNRTESANSLFSAASGFTYWMLDEKDLYHPLPDNLETGVSKLFHTKEPDEGRIPSLADLYHRKQREYAHRPAWEPLSPSEHTHPPEILTLDPTLHKKHLDGVSPGNESYTAPLTPDSILESAPYKQYDEESLSAASSVLRDSPNRSPHSSVADVEQWKSSRYQTSGNINYQPCQGDASIDERMNCTEDDVNSLTPSSMPQSPLPVAEENISHPSGVHSVEHPMMLSNIRRSLREKHARHLADLRDYYESEISNLKQQLVASNKSTTTSEDQMKISSLTEQCAHMEEALAEASKRIRMLENKNNELEKQVAEWKDRYYSASNTSKDLQEQIEEMRTRSKEKENAISRLQSRLKEVEGSFEKAFKQSDDKDERIKQEHKMFQDLLLEYESLGKEHERVKDTLGITENKLCDAQTEVNELRRTVSKLETQFKQLEHENMVKLRHIAEGQPWLCNSNKKLSHTAGSLNTADTAHWKSVTSGTQCNFFTGQPVDNKAKEMDNKHDTPYLPNRYHSPPEKDALHNYKAAKPMTEDSSTQESPILKALRDFEEEKGLKGWYKEGSFHRLSSKQTVGFSDCCTPHASPAKSRDQQKRLNSPAGPRSSSLPPSNRKTSAVTTPTKRELMITPLQVKYSPKRSASENLSPGLSQLLHDEKNTITRFDVAWTEASKFKDPSPRKRLQFMSLEDSQERQKTVINPESSSESQLPLVLPPYETEITYNERMKNITDTERLFDELTEEKKQIEAALSRMPGIGRRMNLQTRAMKENLEDRLEKINRDLGSIRMTLKKYHILPTSANI